MQQSDMQQQEEVLTRSNLVLAACKLTEAIGVNGKSPEEAVAIFTRVYELLDDWFRGTPLKDEIKKVIDTLLPDRQY